MILKFNEPYEIAIRVVEEQQAIHQRADRWAECCCCYSLFRPQFHLLKQEKQLYFIKILGKLKQLREDIQLPVESKMEEEKIINDQLNKALNCLDKCTRQISKSVSQT